MVCTTILVDGVAIGSHCTINNTTARAPAAKQHLHRNENQLKKTERETKETRLWPHARDNQLQVGSSGDPIQPLVAEILNIYQLIGGGGESCCLSMWRCVCLRESMVIYLLQNRDDHN